jgi:hypothetical protein
LFGLRHKQVSDSVSRDFFIELAVLVAMAAQTINETGRHGSNAFKKNSSGKDVLESSLQYNADA